MEFTLTQVRTGNGAMKRKGLDQLSAVLSQYISESKQGAAFAWGSGSNFQLGETCAFLSKGKPSRVEELPPDVSAVSTSNNHTVVLSSTGTVFTSGTVHIRSVELNEICCAIIRKCIWIRQPCVLQKNWGVCENCCTDTTRVRCAYACTGSGLGGRLGHGCDDSLPLFHPVAGLDRLRVTCIAASDHHTLAITDTYALCLCPSIILCFFLPRCVHPGWAWMGSSVWFRVL